MHSEAKTWMPTIKAQSRSKTKHRDSHSINYRLEDLKARLAKKGKALKMRGAVEITDFMHEVPSWKKSYRFVYKRQEIKVVNHHHQLELIKEYPEYFYHGYATNIQDMQAEEIIKRIDSRGHHRRSLLKISKMV